MKKSEIKKLKDEKVTKVELAKKIGELRVSLAQVKMNTFLGKEKNLKKAKGIKREIAQILGIIQEKRAVNAQNKV